MNIRLNQLRRKMAERNMDAYIIPTSDPHGSEYISDHYKTREFISGFTGSQGTVVVTKNKAGLWVDGRYFLQAEKQLQGSDIDLYRMGQPGVATIDEFLLKEVGEFKKIGLNGETFSFSDYYQLMKKMGTRMLIPDEDYVGDIWTDRPSLPMGKAYEFPLEYAGKSTRTKLKELRFAMHNLEVDYYFIGALDDICYLFNIRGSDIHCVPVIMSYALINQKDAFLYIDSNKIDETLIETLNKQGVTVKDYDMIFEDLKNLSGKTSIYFDPQYTNVTIYNALNDNIRIKKGRNITADMKAHKSEIEINHLRDTHLKDGACLVKFLNWLETGVPTGNVTELSAAQKLDALRLETSGCKDISFDTISAYKENAALPHYKPEEKSKIIRNKGLYLVDSGGQYFSGTTDITRTIALGDLSFDERKHYTLVLKSHIALMTAKFAQGTKATSLDVIARLPLWKEGIDFNHGTGHGVGYFLSCHEGPQTISKRDSDVTMDIGMITSNEPGIYVADSHGIRIENIMVCVEEETNEFGTFLGFECLSCCPIDTRPVIKELLTQDEIFWLNDYNRWCYDQLSSYLEEDDLEYLKRSCESI